MTLKTKQKKLQMNQYKKMINRTLRIKKKNKFRS